MFITVVGDSCKLLPVRVIGDTTGNVASIGVSAIYICEFTFVHTVAQKTPPGFGPGGET